MATYIQFTDFLEECAGEHPLTLQLPMATYVDIPTEHPVLAASHPPPTHTHTHHGIVAKKQPILNASAFPEIKTTLI